MARPSSDAPSASSEQDRTLVSEALEGGQEAYQQLMQKYQEPIRRHVHRMVRDKGMVDDLVQESFIKAFTSLSSYSSDYAFSTWLYKIATNHTIDYLRKRKLSTFSIDQPAPGSDDSRTYEVPDTTYRPDRHVMEDQRRELIQLAIDALPPKYHRVIVMRHQQDLSYDEIAVELDLPLGTVKAHIFRARALLYKYLRDQREHI
ncbi:MAG: sigma-70 family RNA polymerase sigma factor [Rhodothermales bacterium]